MIDRTVFKMDEVYSNLTPGQISILIDRMKIIKLNFLESKEILENSDSSNPIISLNDVTEQLFYIEKNLTVLENALMAHITKIFDKRNFKVGQFFYSKN